MTAPEDSQPPTDEPHGAGVTGSLEAASRDEPEAGDPLAPLNALTADDDASSG